MRSDEVRAIVITWYDVWGETPQQPDRTVVAAGWGVPLLFYPGGFSYVKDRPTHHMERGRNKMDDTFEQTNEETHRGERRRGERHPIMMVTMMQGNGEGDAEDQMQMHGHGIGQWGMASPDIMVG